MIYLDYTSTTPVDEEVLETYIKTTHNFFANTSSLHKLGQESNYMYEKASTQVKDILGLKDYNIVYTSNATEANNLGIYGIVNKYTTGKIITTKVEHPSVYEVMKSLEKKFEVIYLDVDEKGIINLEQLEKNIDNNTILVSIMWVNNIVGTIQPIEKVIEMIKKYKRAKLHVDAVQGICKIKPKFDFNEVDLFTFSTHKIYGPKGIGGLLYKKDLSLSHYLHGSNVQYGIKPGTFDLSLIVATTKAFKKYYPEVEKNHKDIENKFNYLYSKLEQVKKIHINTPKTNISHYIINISIPNNNGETIVHYLEQNDIYVSTGSACSSKLKKPEKTIYAMTNSIEYATSSIRISLSILTTYKELDQFLNIIKKYIGE